MSNTIHTVLVEVQVSAPDANMARGVIDQALDEWCNGWEEGNNVGDPIIEQWSYRLATSPTNHPQSAETAQVDCFEASVDKAVYALSKLMQTQNHAGNVDAFGREVWGEEWERIVERAAKLAYAALVNAANESARRSRMSQEERDREDALADATWALQHGEVAIA